LGAVVFFPGGGGGGGGGGDTHTCIRHIRRSQPPSRPSFVLQVNARLAALERDTDNASRACASLAHRVASAAARTDALQAPSQAQSPHAEKSTLALAVCAAELCAARTDISAFARRVSVIKSRVDEIVRKQSAPPTTAAPV
jgi:hypothetical protein